ncbi:hypothetical protein [Acididesulfobacillus acetoxydans]|uniref:hypothetical protein n=1 Tax=Acididesulfobacillus acetoxydans TaxID=1561005 RepID=UPI001F0EEC03|nr:hypothetical protein [Acididesulfobacillus acetoxydans]
MWNKATFLIIGLKTPGFPRISLPVPLFVLEDFLGALGSFVWLGERVWRKWAYPYRGIPLPKNLHGVSTEILQDLRRHKGLRLVDVEASGVRVYLALK